jgi:LmbE family N-acetylglucosaminyl deacetylase
VLAISPVARHSDHIALGRLAERAVKLAALHRLVPEAGPAVPGLRLWWYEAELPLPSPKFLIPSTEADWQAKRAAILAYGSQLARPDGSGPATSIATPEFLQWIEARGRAWGYQAGAAYAEACDGPEALRVEDLLGK